MFKELKRDCTMLGVGVRRHAGDEEIHDARGDRGARVRGPGHEQEAGQAGSVADPPHVFGPPGSGSGSISQGNGSGFGSGSGSFCHQAKKVRKTLIPSAL